MKKELAYLFIIESINDLSKGKYSAALRDRDGILFIDIRDNENGEENEMPFDFFLHYMNINI